MDNTIRVSCSAVTHTGSFREVNGNRVYVNGKFLGPQLVDNSQISLESSGSFFMFALSQGMDMDADSRISIVDELRKFHRKAGSSSKDIQIKLDEMSENVQQTNNLLYSISLGEEAGASLNCAFAGLLIDNGGIAFVNLGNCRIYKVEADLLRPVINDNRKTERLLKMGIINNEQAEMLAGQQKNDRLEGSRQVRKSEVFPVKEGNQYLICSSSLIDVLSEDTAFEILAETSGPDAAAGQLVREAVENGCEDNITAMVIRIEQAAEQEEASVRTVRNTAVRRLNTAPARYSRMVRQKSVDVAKLVSTFVIVAVIAAVIFGTFTLWMNLRDPGKDKDTLAETTTQPTESGSSTTDGIIPDESEEVEETESSTSVEATEPVVNEPAAGDNTTYTVKAGDSLMKISKQFYGEEGKYKKIMEANGITNPDKIFLGQVLKIPPAE